MSLLSYLHIAPRVLADPVGPLSSELLPSAIAEANAAVNGMQQAKTKETIKETRDRSCALYTYANTVLRYSGPGMACSFESSTHYFLVSNSRYGRN